MKPRRGMTLAEVIVAAFLMLLLVTAIFAIFHLGLSAWHKVDTQNELLGQLQVTASNVARDAERSVYESVSVEPGGQALAMLSALYDGGDYAVEDDGSLVWQRYIIYYYDPGGRAVWRREVPLASPMSVPQTLETYDPGGGPQPWSLYKSGGRVLARHIESFTATVAPDPARMVQLSIYGQKDRYGSQAPERASLSTLILMRNR